MLSNVKKILVLTAALALLPVAAFAQQAQIPSLQVCNKTFAQGVGTVKILSRSDILHSGSFVIRLDVKCEPAVDGNPTGTLLFAAIDMSDSAVGGNITATTIDQLTSSGKHTPTAWLTGRCQTAGVAGCRYWLMIADNGDGSPDTPDIVSFLVFDNLGKRIAYGTGPVVDGDLFVSATSN
jgi:hypothetical protein